jgi:hypothetical protein
MKPIYWSPVHDVSSVMRSIWCYQDTMLPVESVVSNLLEEGYMDIRPWTQTYVDEVNSCLEVGPEAELRLVRKLWPADLSADFPSRDGVFAHDLIRPENIAAGRIESPESSTPSSRLYARSSVIYADATNAQILRPNQLPSVARGRRPLAPIRRGKIVGIPVVRGFDYRVWEKLYPPKKTTATRRARNGATAGRPSAGAIGDEQDVCEACMAEETRPQIRELVLVIHG